MYHLLPSFLSFFLPSLSLFPPSPSLFPPSLLPFPLQSSPYCPDLYTRGHTYLVVRLLLTLRPHILRSAVLLLVGLITTGADTDQ